MLYRYFGVITLMLLCQFPLYGSPHLLPKEGGKSFMPRIPSDSITNQDHFNDSIHSAKQGRNGTGKGLKPYLAPALLVAGGTVLHLSPAAKENYQMWSRDKFSYSGSLDDYLQFAPLAATYTLKALGIKGENNFGNTTAIIVKSILINDFLTSRLKTWTGETRPNGQQRSFPSGHTSFTFAMAHLMHKEFGRNEKWISISAYGCAAAVGLMRIAKNAHWVSDVLAGAGIGILSTELVYLTHLYKWDSEHIRNFDIFPFSSGRQKGFTMVLRF